MCLSWWSVSPKTYEHWRSKGQLILPHPESLRRYKNCLQQEPGIQDHMLQWMRQEADRHGLEAEQRVGGLIFDEMSIQVST